MFVYDTWQKLYDYFLDLLFNSNENYFLSIPVDIGKDDVVTSYLLEIQLADLVCNVLTAIVVFLFFFAFIWLIKQFCKTIFGLF